MLTNRVDEPGSLVRSARRTSCRVNLDLVFQPGRLQLTLDRQTNQDRFGVAEHSRPLRGTLGAHGLPTLLDVAQMRLRDPELLGALVLRKILAFSDGLDCPAQGERPPRNVLQHLHRGGLPSLGRRC